MHTFLQKLSRFISASITQFKLDVEFSLGLAVSRLFSEVFFRLRCEKIAIYFASIKDHKILSFLKKEVSEILSKYRDNTYMGTPDENSPIWICWWTGIENAPKLVQQCIMSIISHSHNRRVVIITQNNYSEFLDIPAFFIEKVSKKQILIAHFTDYIRVSLLHKFGGLWLDATIFCTDDIPNYCFTAPFFSCKSEAPDKRYFSKKKWTTFVLGGYRGSALFRYLQDAFECYWSKNEKAIDYLMFDHLIYLAHQTNNHFKEVIESLTPNNPNRDDLQSAMNERQPAENFEQFLNNDTVLYKLSWREKYELTTVDGNESIYSKFLRYDFGENNDS